MPAAVLLAAAPQPRRMEFRRRTLDVGAAIGLHIIARVGPGVTADLYDGTNVGIRQSGKVPLALIITYPVKP
ncbi:hypothetical protein [Novosphingobium humi]|uniref:hypothetical protein n=1 Tax=Novosphingobium humi TaxID=2282397 RepID=UPI003B5C8FF7